MTSTFKTAGLAFLLAGVALAQPPFHARDANGGTPPDPATMIANQVTRLTTLLDLTTAQATQMTSILTAAQAATSSLMTTSSTNQTALQTAITSNATATIDQLSAAIGTADGQRLAIRSKAEAAVYAILTATQQAKVTTLGGLGVLGGGGPGPGGPGGRGPRP
jgi:Spy/CpxP family protein refolding chaperone